MIGVHWVAGDHHALVRPGVLVLVSHEIRSNDVLRVWEHLDALESLDGLGSLLDVLSEVTGRGLRSLPDFALAVLDEQGLHLAVRGNFRTEVTHLDGVAEVMLGTELSTWAERNFDTASVAEVVLGAASDATAWLPITGGVVPAGSLRLVLAEVSTPTPAPAPERAADLVATDSEIEVAPAHETLIEPDLDVEPGPDVEAAPTPEPDVEPEPPARPNRFASLLSPHTVIHDIEDAAVRPDDSGLDEPAAAAAPLPTDMPVDVVVEEPLHVEVESPAPAVAPEPAPSSTPATTPPSFISAVPISAAPTSAPLAAPAQATYAPASIAGGHQAVSNDDDLEHHDGHTQLELPDSSELDAYLDQSGAGTDGAMVLGVHCAAGHGNPTHRTACRVCGQHLAGAGVRMPRPPLGWLHTSAGESVELVRNVLAGRDPRASRIQGTVMPRLLPLPHSHVSGTHLEIRLEGWSVLVADLRSTNGTFLQRRGQPTLRISEAPQLLMSDDVIQLGHGVDLRFEALP